MHWWIHISSSFQTSVTSWRSIAFFLLYLRKKSRWSQFPICKGSAQGGEFWGVLGCSGQVRKSPALLDWSGSTPSAHHWFTCRFIEQCSAETKGQYSTRDTYPLKAFLHYIVFTQLMPQKRLFIDFRRYENSNSRSRKGSGNKPPSRHDMVWSWHALHTPTGIWWYHN